MVVLRHSASAMWLRFNTPLLLRGSVSICVHSHTLVLGDISLFSFKYLYFKWYCIMFYYVRWGKALLTWLHSTMLWGPYKLSLVFTCYAYQAKNGDLQFCIDYWWLNDITKKKNCFTLTRTDDTLNVVAAAKWVFLTLDLKRGYWQVPCITATSH
jgi:hypothetical protein